MSKVHNKFFICFLLFSLLSMSFFMGQTVGTDSAYAATPLPVEGTIMEATVGSYEYIAQEDGNISITLTSGYGGDGGAGGQGTYYNWGSGSHPNGAPGTPGTPGNASSNGNGGNGGSGTRATGARGGDGGAGGGGVGLVFTIDGKNILAVNGGNGGAGGAGGAGGWSYDSSTNPGNPGSNGIAGATKTLTTVVKKGQVIIIAELSPTGSTGGNISGGAGGAATKSGWSFTLQSSKKVFTESDGFEASNRQATAMERMATAFEKMVSGGAINNDNGSVSGTPMISVIAGKAFNTFITGEKSKLGSWKSDGITIINNDINDNYLQVIGNLSDVGFKEILVDGTKYIFNIIDEPNSTNVKVVFN